MLGPTRIARKAWLVVGGVFEEHFASAVESAEKVLMRCDEMVSNDETSSVRILVARGFDWCMVVRFETDE